MQRANTVDGRKRWTLEEEDFQILDEEEESKKTFLKNKYKWRLILVSIAVIIILVCLIIHAFTGGFSWQTKQLLAYDKFASSLAKTGLTTNALDQISYNTISISGTDKVGNYRLTIGTQKGTIIYNITKGGHISPPTLIRSDVFTWIGGSIIVICLLYSFGTLLDFEAEIKKKKA